MLLKIKTNMKPLMKLGSFRDVKVKLSWESVQTAVLMTKIRSLTGFYLNKKVKWIIGQG